jgi:putative FmdB family regulatory protein
VSPLFDYQCPMCKSVRENVLTTSINAPLPWCACGEQMRKMWSTFEPRFKGSGFYENDYKQKPDDTGGTENAGEHD